MSIYFIYIRGEKMAVLRNSNVNNVQEPVVQTPSIEYKQMSPDEFWKAMTFISTQNQFFISRVKHIM